MKAYSVIIIGAGCRGGMYADLMAQHPDKYRVIGFAAEEARHTNTVVDVAAYLSTHGM